MPGTSDGAERNEESQVTPHGTVGRDSQLEAARAIIRSLQEELEMAKKQIESLLEKGKELERSSITDELTGLYNQRHFHNRLEQEVERNRRQEHPLCLLFFDVDGLKTYNDTYGHLVGNDVLRAVAQSLFQEIRENVDSGYRCGGDEFAAILAEVNTEQAVGIAKRINIRLQEAGFEHVTLSFGVAELTPGMDSEALFKHADDAMYMAKKGRCTKPNGHTDKIYIYDSNTTDCT